MLLRHDGKMVTNAVVLLGPDRSFKSFFGGYDLPRNEVTSTGCDTGEERPRPEEQMWSSGVRRWR